MSDSIENTGAPSGMKNGSGKRTDNWERDLIDRLAFASLTEQRRARRWGIFFKFLLAIYLALILFLYWPGGLDTSGLVEQHHTALIEINGVIAEDAEASADHVVTGLRDAFEDEKTKGVILRINSPGGSPVQTGYIYDEIKRLREKYADIPLYAVITDLCASGGYYVAAAADKIYADKSSVVGSIGVRMDGFGYVETIKKLGVERRLLTAGEHKGFLDPFLPIKQDEVEHVGELLEEIHQQFIEVVRKGRGDRLSDDDKLFSGLVWTGAKSKELGLVDEIGSTGYVAREVIEEENIVDFTYKADYLDRLAKRFGMVVGKAVVSELSGHGLRME
ncbi:MAG: signal peptide peptidase SppA [Gammaproteobacteria bacterium]|nr:signal peptide peptidase SppA [Gammaproteobacteria bacterium]